LFGDEFCSEEVFGGELKLSDNESKRKKTINTLLYGFLEQDREELEED
jgi:hypothetical protein